MKVFMLMVGLGIFSLISQGALGDEDEEGDQEEETTEEEASPTMICEQLKEEISIYQPLQQALSLDFSRVTDPSLCQAMAAQCEDFTDRLKKLYKEYRSECDPDYDIPKVAVCDYSVNPCVKKPKTALLQLPLQRGLL